MNSARRTVTSGTSKERPRVEAPLEIPGGATEMAARIRAFDWATTPLGPSEHWPVSLKMMLGLILASRFPHLLWWGPDYICIYNDAYTPILGNKHPWALGQPVREVWSEIWDQLQPLIDTPYHGGPATWIEDFELLLNRHGYLEEGHYTVGYSPVPDATAPRGIGGVVATVHVVTAQIIDRRRIEALGEYAARSADAKTAEQSCAIAIETLAKHPKDMPFALLYLVEPQGDAARLIAATGLSTGLLPPESLRVRLGEDAEQVWPLSQAARQESAVLVDELSGVRSALLPSPLPPRQAITVPILASTAHQPAGFLVAGISPVLQLDDQYRSYFQLTASGIGTAIANARAYEQERQRAAALAEIDRAKTVFFSNVSHELRTPLTLILGPVEESVADPLTPAPLRKRLELAHRNAMRLAKLVNSLLDFARIEADRARASCELTDLAALTRELAESFRGMVERAGLALEVNCELAEPVAVDREMWEKIVLNLLSNAFKFTFTGTISVSLRREASEAVLEVRDSGVGIPAQELPHLFQRFHRVDGAPGRTVEGSGIGLAMVQELVKLHGGCIRVQSELGRGSSFRVTLPMDAQPRASQAPRLTSTAVGARAFVEEASRWMPDAPALPQPAPADAAAPSPAARPRVLLAEDNADMRDYVRGLLASSYIVEAVADGAQALAAARGQVPDLVLADVMMPQLDGIGLVKALRADPALREVPVILLSARAGEEARVEGLDAGADDYLVKPFPARELLARVSGRIELTHMRRANEQRLLSFVGATSDFIYQMNPDWSRMHFLHGQRFLTHNDSPGGGWLERFIYPEDQPQLLQLIGEHIKNRTVLSLEHRIRGFDGKAGWVSSRAIPVLDKAGNIIEWFGAASDVTARKQTEQRLREREEALRAAHAELQSGMADLANFARAAAGRESRMIELKQEVNQLHVRLGERTPYSAAPAQEPESTGPDLLYWQEPPGVPLDEVLANEELAARPARPPDREAENRALTALARTMASAPRSLLQTLAETVLRELRAGSAGIAYLTPDGRHLHRASRAGAWGATPRVDTPHTLGPTVDALRRNTPLLFTHWERRYPALESLTPPATEALLVPYQINGTPAGIIWVASHDPARRFDAEDLRLLSSLGGFAAAATQAVRFLTVADQRRAALNLLDDAEHARQQAESARERLQASEEALREASRRKDEFLALLGHELRNPIAPIVAAGELLSRMRADDPRGQIAIGMIRRQAAQLTRLVDDLLDVGRITQGRIQLDLRPLDLAGVVAQALETVEPQLREKQQEAAVTASPETLNVRGDYARLVQCLVNLLSNAVKYSEPRSQIRLRTLTADGDALIEVSDDGAGIPAELLPRVFDLFVQGDRTLDRSQGGLGIGLSIVMQLIQMHGGQVSARSPGLGQGSTFEIRLPRIDAPARAPEAAVCNAPPRRVLIVDDNADSASSLSLLLGLSGHQTLVALSGQEALDSVASFQPDVALLDIGLPELDGYQLARRLRALPQLTGTRLVALTGYGQSEDRERALAAGFHEHIVKPVDPATLERILAARPKDAAELRAAAPGLTQ